ncbi:BTAD domain-containing putative transcriptional regulator [Streptomyces sp. NPDC102340]|uniref:AfsR/SARP family transcriptional regulator n=1 Tax=unclassified Streptomyces TaxID=2593676 RepID=UPI003809525F
METLGTGWRDVVRYEVLGPVRALRAGTGLRLGTPQQLALLAVLLLHGGRPVERHELVAALWGERPPAGANGLLATYAARLRKVLEPDRPRRTSPRVLVTRNTAYGLELGRDDLDLWRFEDAVAEARSARRNRDLDAARSGYERALAVWTGEEALAGAVAPFVEVERLRLGELRLAARLEHAAVLLEFGASEETVEVLRPLARAHPHHERLHALLMLALYRGGRTGQALEVYQDIRQALLGEFGVPPGPRLARIHERILAADPWLLPRAAGAPLVPAQLPRDIADFSGRASELGRLRHLLAAPHGVVAGPSVLVTGPPGVGKSALAVHAAHQVAPCFPDGQLYAELGGATGSPVEPADVLGRLLTDLGVPAAELPDGAAHRAARFRTLTARRRLLLLLDDAHDEAQVRQLLPGGPGCAVLVTSRFRLATLPGRSAVPLSYLREEESLRMLTRVAGADRVAAQPAAARTLARVCAGRPLAVRALGARIADADAAELPLLADRLASPGSRAG